MLTLVKLGVLKMSDLIFQDLLTTDKIAGVTMQDRTHTDQMTGVGKARPENDGTNDRGGQCKNENGPGRRKVQDQLLEAIRLPTLSLIRGCHSEFVGSRSHE